MKRLKLLLDTNVCVDYLNRREPFFEDVRNLMVLGYVDEVELWITSTQMTDLVYISTDGGKPRFLQKTLERLRKFRQIVNVYPVGECEIDKMLLTNWKDPEDFLIYQCAISMSASAILTRNACDFEEQLIKVCDCKEFFKWIYESYSMKYSLVDLKV